VSGVTRFARVAAGAAIAIATAAPAFALPTMVRLGYTGCTT
jgi:hypothetical protein